MAGRRVDGGAAPPQRVEPRHERGVVLETVPERWKLVERLDVA